MAEVKALREFVRQLPTGELHGDVRRRVLELLSECWDELAGSTEVGMRAFKLERAERLRWKPPGLDFTLERHGGTVLGSARAELQDWHVDVEAGEASCAATGQRQLRPPQSRLDVDPLADALAATIRLGQKDERLAWDSAGRVRVLIGMVIPSTGPAQTVAGRRRRLREQLRRCLAPDWKETRPNTYEKAP